MQKSFWADKKVLVVGGAGFIGSHTVDALVDRGADVAIVDNFSTGVKKNCNPGAALYTLDASDAPRLGRVFTREKPELVMVFSALVDVPFAIANPSVTAQNITATVNVLEQSVKHGVEKVLYASSGFIYGNAARLPTPESEAPQPLNPYSISKAACENYCRFFQAHHGLPFVALRYAPLYGPRRTIGPIVDYIRKISRGQRAEIYGSRARDYTYIGDAVRANLMAMEQDVASRDPVFNIGAGREASLTDIYSMIATALGRPGNEPILKTGKPSEVKRSRLDISKAKRSFGFEPEVHLREGLQRTIEWFSETTKAPERGRGPTARPRRTPMRKLS